MKASNCQFMLTFAVLFAIASHGLLNALYQDYTNHPCTRSCKANMTTPMFCEYNWTMERYSVLSKACLDCPYNMTNCFRPNCVAANGLPRPIFTINRMLPGPAIYVCQNDTIQVNVHNHMRLSDVASIHWHGIKQKGTPYMDGTTMYTQCPLLPSTSFEYNFAALDPGTHIWHAHAGTQRADGLFGAIVVRQYDNENVYAGAYDYDLMEHIMIVNEWINDTSASKLTAHEVNDGNNKPDSMLINGRGVLVNFNASLGGNGSFGIVQTPRAIFNVQNGYRYRFRVINAGFLYCPIEISIDNHTLTVISSDGHDVEAYTVASLIVYAGERYDFVLTANQPNATYWIRAKGWADCGVNSVYTTAILSYNTNTSDSTKVPLPSDPSLLNYKNLNQTGGLQLNSWNRYITNDTIALYANIDQLRSKIDSSATAAILNAINTTNVRRFYLYWDFNKITNTMLYDPVLYPLQMTLAYNRAPFYTPQINHMSLMMPSTPVLYNWDQIDRSTICNTSNINQTCPNYLTEYCACLYTLELNVNDVVEFVMTDEAFTYQSNHPMHLHGHSFAVVGMGRLNQSVSADYVRQLDQMGMLKRNFDRPPLKDSVTVPAGGYTIIRFVADNPGSWLFHCHLDFHSEVGMALIVKVGGVKDLPPPPPNWPQCGNFKYKKPPPPPPSPGHVISQIWNFIKNIF